MKTDLDRIFPQIVPGRSNVEVLDEALGMLVLRELVVLNLARFETEDLGHFWWEDKSLMKIFNDLYSAGVLPLPKEPVDRLRWIALLCVECCSEEGFAWGNVVIPLDFLQVDEFTLFEDVYTHGMVEEVLAFRKKLAELGWEKAFE